MAFKKPCSCSQESVSNVATVARVDSTTSTHRQQPTATSSRGGHPRVHRFGQQLRTGDRGRHRGVRHRFRRGVRDGRRPVGRGPGAHRVGERLLLAQASSVSGSGGSKWPWRRLRMMAGRWQGPASKRLERRARSRPGAGGSVAAASRGCVPIRFSVGRREVSEHSNTTQPEFSNRLIGSGRHIGFGNSEDRPFASTRYPIIFRYDFDGRKLVASSRSMHET